MGLLVAQHSIVDDPSSATSCGERKRCEEKQEGG